MKATKILSLLIWFFVIEGKRISSGLVHWDIVGYTSTKECSNKIRVGHTLQSLNALVEEEVYGGR